MQNDNNATQEVDPWLVSGIAMLLEKYGYAVVTTQNIIPLLDALNKRYHITPGLDESRSYDGYYYLTS